MKMESGSFERCWEERAASCSIAYRYIRGLFQSAAKEGLNLLLRNQQRGEYLRATDVTKECTVRCWWCLRVDTFGFRLLNKKTLHFRGYIQVCLQVLWALVSDLIPSGLYWNWEVHQYLQMIRETLKLYSDISVYIKTRIMPLNTKTAVSLFSSLSFCHISSHSSSNLKRRN